MLTTARDLIDRRQFVVSAIVLLCGIFAIVQALMILRPVPSPEEALKIYEKNRAIQNEIATFRVIQETVAFWVIPSALLAAGAFSFLTVRCPNCQTWVRVAPARPTIDLARCEECDLDFDTPWPPIDSA